MIYWTALSVFFFVMATLILVIQIALTVLIMVIAAYAQIMMCAILLVIHTADYESTNKALLFGPDTDDIKVKADVFAMELGRNIAILANPAVTKVQDLEGLLIVPFYNKYGTCTGFNLSMGAESSTAPADIQPEKKK